MVLPDLSLALGRGSSLDSFGLRALNQSSRVTPMMTPEEEDSLATQVGKGSLGALAGAGNFLDLPGSMVRDALALKNPFDQLLSPFSDENRTTGRDLLRQYGMVGKKDTWGNFFGGLGAEILLDPTTYLSLGTMPLSKSLLTNAGRVATRAGATADDIAKAALKASGKVGANIGQRTAAATTTFGQWLDYGDDTLKALKRADAEKAFKSMWDRKEITGSFDDLLNEPLQTFGRVELPVPFTNLGFNFGDMRADTLLGRSGRGMAQGMDALGSALDKTFPVRAARSLFDSRVKGKLDYNDQQVARAASAAEKLGRSEGYQKFYESVTAADSVFNEFVGQYGGKIAVDPGETALIKQLDTFQRVLRMTAETNGDYRRAMQTVMNIDPETDDTLLKFSKSISETLPADQKDMAPALTAVWKSFAEGYRGENPGEWLGKAMKDVIRSAKPENVGASALFQGEQGAAFYSKLAQVVDTKVGGTTTWEQLRATLEGAGVKAEEIRDTGLEQLFAGGKKVSKAELQDHLADNAVKVVETVLGDGGDDTVFAGYQVPGGTEGSYRELLLKLPPGKLSEIPGSHFGDDVLAHARVDDVVLPDGRKALRIQEVQSDLHQGARTARTDALRDQFFAENPSAVPSVVGKKESEELFKAWRKLPGNEERLPKEYGYLSAEEGSITRELSRLTTRENALHDQFQEAHAPVRKAVSKIIHEIERASPTFKSDHELEVEGFEALTRRGMALPAMPTLDLRRSVEDVLYGKLPSAQALKQASDKWGWEATLTLQSQLARVSPEVKQSASVAGKVLSQLEEAKAAREAMLSANPWLQSDTPKMPDAPFKDSWHDLAMKHVLKYAAEKGYEAVTLVKGEDIAAAVGGPAEALGKFYDDKLTNSLKKYTKKWGAYKGEVNAVWQPKQLDWIRDDASDPDSMQYAWIGTNTRYEIQRSDAGSGFALSRVTGGDDDGATEIIVGHFPSLREAGRAAQDAVGAKTQQLFDISPQMRADILKGQPLYQSGKGAVEFAEDGKAIISMFAKADVTTHLHEFSHVARRWLKEDDAAIANRWVGATDAAAWTREQEEKFATGFEQYMKTGQAPDGPIKAMFDRLKAWVVKIYQSLAGTPHADQIPQDIKDLYGRMIGTEASSPAARLKKGVVTLGEQMRVVRDEVMSDILEKGGRGFMLEAIQGADQDAAAALDDQLLNTDGTPGFAHFPRTGQKQFMSPADALMENQKRRTIKTAFGNMLSRVDATRHIPSEIVNKMAVDPQIHNQDAIQAAQYILSTPDYAQYLGRTTAFDNDKSRHAVALAEYLKERSKKPIYDTATTFDDHLKYVQRAHVISRSLSAVAELAMRNATYTASIDNVSLKEALRGTNLDAERFANHVGKLWAKDPANAADIGKLTADNARIPLEVAKAIRSYMTPIGEPWGKEIGKVIDDLTGIFKGSLTLPFPSFHGRNFTSGQFANIVMSGAIRNLNDLREYAASVKDVMGMAAQGDSRSARDLAREMAAFNALDKRSVAEGVEVGQEAAKLGGPEFPLVNLAGSWKRAEGRVGEFMADYNLPGQGLPGVSTSRVGLQAVMEEGGKLAGVVEWANRAGMYTYLKKKGYSPEAAASVVRKMHVDYSDLSPFEKTVMRRLMPFYAFQRGMAPVILGTLWERPGGALSQTIQGLGAARDSSDPLMPDYVSQTASIPLGESEPGTKKYLTGLGLPFEQTFAFMDGGVRGSMREVASQLSPFVKAPLEYATNQSFFQAGPGGAGRSLEDLNPTIGQTLANLLGTKEPVNIGQTAEFIAGASPASRVFTTARKLSDTRKDTLEKLLSVTTGLATTDVSPAAQDAVLRDRSRDVMRNLGARAYERVYFPSWQLETEPDPARRRQMESLNMLQTVLASRARRRAEDMRGAASR